MRCDVCAAVAQIVIRISYEGEVNQDGERHGKGVQSFSDGQRYVGEFRNNGDRYVGEWSEGNYHGNGTLTYPDGRVKSGKWENARFLG